MSERVRNYERAWWYEDGWYIDSRRPHEVHLDRAYYSRILSKNEEGFQHLADAYNEYVRKEDEAPLRPPPKM